MLTLVFIDRIALAKQGDDRIGSVRPFVFALTVEQFAVHTQGSALPSAASTNLSHYQSKVFVCL